MSQNLSQVKSLERIHSEFLPVFIKNGDFFQTKNKTKFGYVLLFVIFQILTQILRILQFSPIPQVSVLKRKFDLKLINNDNVLNFQENKNLQSSRVLARGRRERYPSKI